MLALGFLYLFMATPKYTATFFIMIDTHKNQLLSKQEITMNGPMDPGLVESQVEILKSDSVALAVVRDLKLTRDEEFMGSGGVLSTLVWLISFGSEGSKPTETELENAAVVKLVQALKVKRVGLTYVLQVDFTSPSASKAAQIANALADAYMLGELEAKYQSMRRAGKWLQDRLKDLREQASNADRAVQKFKADNNLVDTSRGLMSEQQLSDVNAQLVAARAATAEAKARLDRVVEVSEGDVVEGSVADALHSEVVTRLRAQYLDLAAKEGDLANRYGRDHGAVVNLRNQMDQIKHSVREELRRIAESSRSDYEVAAAREHSIQASLDLLVSQAGTNNQAQVQLRDLESSSQTYRNLYENFLQKFEETAQQQTFPVTDARVITPATVPDRPSWPKAIFIVPGSVMLGLVFGFTAALAREFLGNNFRGSEDVANYAGFECLGILPNLSFGASSKGLPKRGMLGASSTLIRHSVDAPFSRFTETIRNVKVSIDIARSQEKSGVVGIVSSVPREGKTTFASNLALLAAQMGHKTLLIDGDLHNPSMTKTLSPGVKIGLIDVLMNRASVADVLQHDSVTGLDFLPAVVAVRQSNVVALLTSRAMTDLLARARTHYEYVFIDLPPVVPVVDVKAAAHMIDNFIFVIEWGVTSRDVVRDALESADQLRQRTLGCVLNKADPGELKRFEAYKGRYYQSYYIEAEDSLK